MLGDWKFFGVVMGGSLGIYFLHPFVAICVVLASFSLIFMAIKLQHMDTLLQPLGPDEIILLWITKTRKITIQRVKEKAEGYLDLEGHGVVKAVPNTNFTIYGKPCVIGVQGTIPTARPELMKIADRLEAAGVNDRKSIEIALGIHDPTKQPEPEKEEEKNVEEEPGTRPAEEPEEPIVSLPKLI